MATTTISNYFYNYTNVYFISDDDDIGGLSPREFLQRSKPMLLKFLEWCLRLVCLIVFAVAPFLNYKLIRLFQERPYHKQSSVKWYIMFKAFFDSLFVFISAPIVFALTFNVDLVHRNAFTCKITAYFHYFSDDMVSMMLTLACVDRMLRVTCGYRLRTRISLIVSHVITILSIIFNLHHIFRLKFNDDFCRRHSFLFFESDFDIYYSYIYTGVTLVIVFICSINLGISIYCDRIQRLNRKEEMRMKVNGTVRRPIEPDRLGLVDHMDEVEQPAEIIIESPVNKTELIQEQEQQDNVDLQLTICVLITAILFLICSLPNFIAVVSQHRKIRILSMKEIIYGHFALCILFFSHILSYFVFNHLAARLFRGQST